MEERTNIDLKKLTDKQKMLVSQIGYLDISDEGIKKIKQDGLTIKELSQYLDSEYADKPYLGNLIPKEGFDVVAGKDTISSEKELVQELIDAQLGDLKITDIISMDSGMHSITNGFKAMAFEDEIGNKGISYSGSDFDKDFLGDWASTNLGEYITNNSEQVKEAQKFFEKNKNENGNNFIYGHSLGGNLTAHTYVKNYNEIQEAFTINGTPINTDELSKEQIEALNDSKYNCCVVGLDPVSQLKNYNEYEKNVKYIRNNGKNGKNSMYAHAIQSATYDDNGNFIFEDSKEKAYEGEWVLSKAFADTSKVVHSGIQDAKDKLEEKKEFPNVFEKMWKNIKEFVKNVRIEPAEVNLDNIKDSHKVLLSRMSYFDFTEEAFEKIKRGESIKISELSEYIKEENSENQINIEGKSAELKDLIEAGFGELEIVDIAKDESGFGALAFRDKNGNVGISYRPSDLSYDQIEKDWLGANLDEFMTGDSEQANQAKEFFARNKDEQGDNYLYGYSLGGSLANHTYLENYKDIKEAFVWNAPPIEDSIVFYNRNQTEVRNIIEAFNDPEKYQCYATAGDYISQVKSTHLYPNNIKYIQSKYTNDISNLVNNHMAEAVKYDAEGNFKTTTKEKAMDGMLPVSDIMVGTKLMIAPVYYQTKGLNKIKKVITDICEPITDFYDNNLKEPLTELYNKVIKNPITALKNIFLKEEKLALPEATGEKIETKKDIKNISKAFKESYSPLNFVNDAYTLEDAKRALEMSNNPQAFINSKESADGNIQKDNSEEITM